MIAELYAIMYLFVKGYRIRAWRYKTPVGEVDVIASKNKTLAFVEVKLRPTKQQGIESVTANMRYRISRAATHYLTKRSGGDDVQMRFDIIVISGFRLYHLDNAWFPTT